MRRPLAAVHLRELFGAFLEKTGIARVVSVYVSNRLMNRKKPTTAEMKEQ